MAERREVQPDPGEVLQRVAALEKKVADLESRLASITTKGGRTSSEVASSGFADPPVAASATPPVWTGPPRTGSEAKPALRVAPSDPGQWLGRLGIALLLLGVVFGFKYSIDRGWLGPAVRVASGLGLGVALLAMGSRLREARPGLSRLLSGGGLVCGYFSIYAAFQLYDLVSLGAAFAAMSVVTITAFVLAVRDDEAVMATLGTAGGLATPFLLYAGEGGTQGLVLHTCVVVAGAAAIFAKCGWRVLLWTVVVGAWPVLHGAALAAHRSGGADAVVVEAGLLFFALCTWGLAVGRELVSAEDPAVWRPTRVGFGPELPRRPGAPDWTLQTHQLVLLVPLALFASSSVAWSLGETATGWLALVLAGIAGGASFPLRERAGEVGGRLAATHVLSTAVLLAFAMSFLLGPETRLVALSAEALALHVLARRARDRAPALLGHLLFTFAFLGTFEHRREGADKLAWSLGLAELADLAVLAALGAAAVVQDGDRRRLYAFVAQAGLLMWLLDILQGLPNGAACVTAAWFANAIVLVVVGLRRDDVTLRAAGAGVMALTMAKLFVFDLSKVDAGWRIVVFLGFGAVLLGLGYAFPALWKRDRDDDVR
jgi:uncharacterized membrane protein